MLMPLAGWHGSESADVASSATPGLRASTNALPTECAVGMVFSPLKDGAGPVSPVSSDGVRRFHHWAEHPSRIRRRHVEHAVQFGRQRLGLLGVTQVAIAEGVLDVVTHLKQIGSHWFNRVRVGVRARLRSCMSGRVSLTAREGKCHAR